MSLRNYTVVPLDDDHQAQLELRCWEMDRRDHDACRRCGGPSEYGGWACWACRSQCHHPTDMVLSGYIYRNDGSLMAYSRCFDCGRMAKALPRGSRVLDVCLRDNRGRWGEPCEHCGAAGGTQRHHWAPQAIFDDPEQWPTAWLCRPCHALWHDLMRRAGGVSLRRVVAS